MFADTEAQATHYRARYYDPSQGRFLSEDPTAFTSGMNFFEYSYNSPATFGDPTGLQPAPLLVPPPAPTLVVVGGTAATGAAATSTVGLGATFGAAVETGSVGGPVGVLVATIAVVGTYDAVQFHNLGEAYGWWGGKRPGTYIAHSRGSLNQQGAAKCETAQKRNSDDGCDRMYEEDTALCNRLKSAACHAQAMERWAACKAGKPIPPFHWRTPFLVKR